MIHKPTTTLEADLAAKDSLVLQAAEATHHLVSVLSSVHSAFWALPTDRLLAVLNDDIPATLATFSHNSAIGAAGNASLDALDLPRFAHRAPTTMGRTDIIFDGTTFIHVSPPEPEPPSELI